MILTVIFLLTSIILTFYSMLINYNSLIVMVYLSIIYDIPKINIHSIQIKIEWNHKNRTLNSYN